MKKINIKLWIGTFVFCFLTTWTVFAQENVSELILNTPINTTVTKGKMAQYKIQLSANQTAQVEVDFNGMNILLNAYKPSGEKYITLNSPAGRTGKKVLLVTSKEGGEYKVEIILAHPFPRNVEIKTEITEIRDTIPHDNFVNESYVRIAELRNIPVPFPNMTIEQQRDAVKGYKEILRLSKLLNDKNFEGFSLITVGHLYWAIGQIQESLDAWLEARELYRQTQNRQYEGVAISNIATSYYKLGQYNRSLQYLNEAKTLIGESINRFDKAILLTNFGRTYLALNQINKAKENFQQALDLYAAMKFKSAEAKALGSLGQVFLRMSDYPKAIDYLQKSIAISKKSGALSETTASNFSLGRAFWELGRKEDAHKQYQEAFETAKKTGRRHDLMISLFRLALIEHDKGNIEKAIKHLESGLKIVEKTRSELGSKELRASYFSKVLGGYEFYTDLLIERSKKTNNSNDISLAFEMSEHSRSRSLVDLLKEARVDFRKGVNVKLLEKEKDLANALSRKYRSRVRFLRQKLAKDKLDKVNAEINNLEIELDKLALQIQQESPKYANLTRGKTLSTKEIQELLDDETVLLEYKLGKKRSHLWLVTNNSIKHFELPRADRIDSEAQTFYRETVRNGTDYIDRFDGEQIARGVYQTLIGKVENEIKGKRLAIVTDGILQYLPFSSLRDSDSNFLADTNEIVMLPSASVLAQIRQSSSVPNSKTIAIFADPVFDKEDSRLTTKPQTLSLKIDRVTRDFRFGEKLPRLLASRQEARSIYSLVGKKKASVQTDFDASVDNITTSNLKDYRILHFATHGLLNTQNPELSGLIFSLYDQKGKAKEGFLSLNDIYNLDLSSDMVVLSACQTALGKEVRGEGLIGLSRGFLYAGSKRIVASLWKVDDAATAEFMKRFYKNHLKKGMSASKALQQTKIEMKKIKRYNSPYYWSAFTLLGDWK